MKRGEITIGESITDYHKSGCVSHSSLEIFRDPDRGPARFKGTVIDKTIPGFEGSTATDIGRAIDALLLEKKTIFETLPLTYGKENKPFNLNSNECKAIKAGIEARGLIPLKKEDADTVRAMYEAAQSNPTAMALLSAGESQLSFRYDFGRFKVQVRPDWWNKDGVTLPDGTKLGAYIVDLKSAEDAAGFQKNRRNYGYDRQAALYCELVRMVLADIGGMKLEDVPEIPFFFCVVYKTPPVQCVVTVLDKQDLATASAEVFDDIRKLKECYETGIWPGAPTGIVTLPSLDRRRAADNAQPAFTAAA